jgi:CxxC motif-containing protein
MERKELTCIGCPMGCQITVELENGEILSVTGNTCAIGDRYARNEVIHPERTVTSTAVVDGGDKPRVSVKTAGNIPKDKIFECMKAIDAVRVKAPVHIGDVIIKDVVGTGVDVVATRNIN